MLRWQALPAAEAGFLFVECAEKLLELRRSEELSETLDVWALAEQRRQDRRTRLLDTSDELLDKLRREMDELEPGNAKALASLVRALKDLRELQGLRKDALDLAEQQARIERLRIAGQRSGNENEDEAAGVLILPAIEENKEPEAES